MRRQVGLAVALTALGACATSSGVTTLEAVEIGWEDPDDPAVQQRRALEAQPCIGTPGRIPTDLAQRVDDWTNVVDCSEPHFLQIIGTVPAPESDVDHEALQDRWSDAYRGVRDAGDRACRDLMEDRLGLGDALSMMMVDREVLFRPAAAAGSGPSYAFFTAVPAAMWDAGEHELACYVEWGRPATYSLADFVTVGSGVPADERRCFDYGDAVACSEQHAFEAFLDADVTRLVDAGIVADRVPGDDASDVEIETFFAPLDEICWSASDALGLPIPPDMWVLSWADRFSFPTTGGAYEITCQVETEFKAFVTGSLFD